MPAPLKNLEGKKWGYVAYLYDTGLNEESEKMCVCRCDNCGRQFEIQRKRIMSGKVTHCGCLRERNKENAEDARSWDACNDLLNAARRLVGKPERPKSDNPYRRKNE